MKNIQLKFNVIDKLIALSDVDLLHKVDKLLSKIQVDASETFILTNSQREMLMTSEEDIKFGRIIPNEKLNEEEDKWLNE